MEPVASDDGNELPPEIITNILYRLPAKSLGRFRSVSKNWLAQISEPQFIKFHQKTLNRHHIISEYYNSSLYSLPLTQHDENPKNLSPKLPHADVFVFHGSCNGLVLGSSDDLVDAYSLVVFNPTTNEFVEIPESCWEVITNLLEIDIIYGFGYDSLSDDYKVVTVSYFHYSYLIPPDNMCVHVYSLRNNTWKRVSDSPYDHSDRMSAPAVFVNGFLHWIACKGAYRVPVIVAFSIADEEFSEVPTPDLGDQVDIVCKRDCELVVVGEKLGVFVRDEVWLMNEYGVRESWLKISIHGLFEIRMVGPKILYYEDGKIVLVSGGLMGIYDVVEQCFCKTIDISRNIRGLKIKGTYVESLVSPKLRRAG